jgi:UDP-glucuronate 4-epimerase
MTPYYDVRLKRDRNAILSKMDAFSFHEFDLQDFDRLTRLFETVKPKLVIHLAGQAGVRYSIENPRSYIDANIVGSFNVLEACRRFPPQHTMIASTSSVYGDGEAAPFKESAETSKPRSLYAATKKAAEVMAYSYSSLFGLPITAFRFFTVYGPWGRPDMALFKFTAAILEGREIEIFGHGQMSRDFTYIDDLVEGILGLLEHPPATPSSAGDSDEGAGSLPPFRAVNIGAAQPIGIEDFVSVIEKVLGRTARRKYLPMQLGDVRRTYANTDLLRSIVGPSQSTSLDVGVRAFLEWYTKHWKPAEADLPS